MNHSDSSARISSPMMPSPVRLGDVAKVFAGTGISRDDAIERPDTKLPVIGVRDLLEGSVASLERLDSVGFHDLGRAQAYAVKVGDLLLTGRGTQMKFGLVGEATAGAIASANIIVVRPEPQALGGALFAILSSEVFRPKIELLRRGATTLLSLSPKDVANLELDLPSIDEQRRIALLMDEAQSAYRTAVEAAELRRRLARRLIDERLFGSKKS
jgi:restriction endonuclease S subunit